MYSGHTVNMTLCGLAWHTYSHVVPICDGFDPLYARNPICTGKPPKVTTELGEMVRWTTTKIVAWAVVGVGYIVIIATHFHYTLDVFIGCLLTVFVFKYYLNYVRTAHLRDNFLNRIFVWLEDGADDIVLYRENLPRILGAKITRAREMSVTRLSLSPRSTRGGSDGDGGGPPGLAATQLADGV